MEERPQKFRRRRFWESSSLRMKYARKKVAGGLLRKSRPGVAKIEGTPPCAALHKKTVLIFLGGWFRKRENA